MSDARTSDSWVLGFNVGGLPGPVDESSDFRPLAAWRSGARLGVLVDGDGMPDTGRPPRGLEGVAVLLGMAWFGDRGPLDAGWLKLDEREMDSLSWASPCLAGVPAGRLVWKKPSSSWSFKALSVRESCRCMWTDDKILDEDDLGMPWPSEGEPGTGPDTTRGDSWLPFSAASLAAALRFSARRADMFELGFFAGAAADGAPIDGRAEGAAALVRGFALSSSFLAVGSSLPRMIDARCGQTE